MENEYWALLTTVADHNIVAAADPLWLPQVSIEPRNAAGSSMRGGFADETSYLKRTMSVEKFQIEHNNGGEILHFVE